VHQTDLPRLPEIVADCPCPVVGIDPRKWTGIGFLGEYAGSERSGFTDVQLTYLDRRFEPRQGLGVTTIRWKSVMGKEQVWRWMTTFAARFRPNIVDEARTRGEVFFGDDFSAFKSSIEVLGKARRLTIHKHSQLPLSCFWFPVAEERCRIAVGVWGLGIEQICPLLMVVDHEIAEAHVDLSNG